MKPSKNTLNKIEAFVEHWEATKNTYFWTPAGNRHVPARKYYDAKNTMYLKFKFNHKKYDCGIEFNSSSRNVYTTKWVNVDNEKKNIRALKALIK